MTGLACELSLLVSGLCVLGLPEFPGRRSLSSLVCTLGLFFAFVFAAQTPLGVWEGFLDFDALGRFFRGLFIAGTALTLLFHASLPGVPVNRVCEARALLLFQCVGLCFLVIAKNILLMFVAQQFVMLSAIGLVGMFHEGWKRTQAMMRLFIFGVIHFFFFVLGLGFLFLWTPETAIPMWSQLPHQALHGAFLCWFMALLLPLGIFPMYWVFPEMSVRLSGPMNVMLSLGVRFGAMALALRFLSYGKELGLDFTRILFFMKTAAALSILMGAVLALTAKDLRRFAGALVLHETGLLLLGSEGPGFHQALLAKLSMDLGAITALFLVVALVEGKDRAPSHASHPFAMIALLVSVLSLLGLNASFGAYSHFGLLSAAMQQGQGLLVFAALIASMMTCLGGLRFVAGVAFAGTSRANPVQFILLLLTLVPLLGFAYFPQVLFHWTGVSF